MRFSVAKARQRMAAPTRGRLALDPVPNIVARPLPSYLLEWRTRPF
jgi:hypothetical protein